ncbi:MAG TPA: M20/M25/M40 family metallo-hydrolase, partial [Tepidisphaeraceae bacterium]|nr:M20/M25/M40 family metallo-hydrolase [Tepidisphaeraceae bacterium]
MVLVVAAWIGHARLGPPADDPTQPPGWDDRALADVQAISREPRPRGSDAHLGAREYLVTQLRDAGWTVETPSAHSPRYFQRSGIRLEVINIIATLPGAEPGPRLMLMAHYDSRRYSPGAGDDASGVAAVLHAARKLAERAERRNEVVVVLTDGEEEGLVGALALFEQQIDPESIGALLNFEGRGSWGPVVMFESEGNERVLINHFSAAVRRPVTSSLAAELYRIMPNATDFTVSRGKGVPG